MTSNDSNLTLSWKRPWSIDEIIKSSKCWSLAADSGVCELLKTFSTNLLTEVGQLSKNVKELSVESMQTNVIIQNAFNEFCMLANNQFMENLVEDVASIPLTNDNSKTNDSNKENALAQIIPQVTESLKMGIQVLESQFEIMDVPKPVLIESNADESDTEERNGTQSDYLTNEPIYHPKDPYENRHLPHLIGTQAFIEDDTLGIGDIDDQEELQESSQASEHSLEADKLSISSFSDSEHENRRKIVSNSEDEKIDSNSEDEKIDSNSEDDKDLFNLKPPDVKKKESVSARVSITDQLQAQLREKLNIKIPNQKTDANQASIKEDENIGSDNISSSISSNKLMKTNDKKPVKLLTNTTGVFSDESADDEDIFGDISKNKRNISSIANSSAKVSNTNASSKPGNSSAKLPVQSDSDNDLFQTDQKKNPLSNITDKSTDLTGNSNKSLNNAPGLNSKVMSESEDDLFNDKIQKPKSQTFSSIKRKENIEIDKGKKISPLSPSKMHSESEDDIFKSNSNAVSKPTVSHKLPPNKRFTQAPFLSTDSDSDELFPSPKKQKENKKSDSPSILPKVESITKISNQIPKDKKLPIVGSKLRFSETSSSEDDFFEFLKQSKNSKPINKKMPIVNPDPIKKVNDSTIENPKSENTQPIINKDPDKDTSTVNSNNINDNQDLYVSKEMNNSSNNPDENKSRNESFDSFDELISDGKSSLKKTEKSNPVDTKVKTEDKNISKFHPLALPPERDPLKISDNSVKNDEILKADSSHLPKPIPRHNTPKDNAGSILSETNSPPNSKYNPLESEPIIDQHSRESLPKLPAGAKEIVGLSSKSFLDEMKSHQRNSRILLKSESDSIVEDYNQSITIPQILDPVELPKHDKESETPIKNDFKQKLQNMLNIKPFEATMKQPSKPISTEENDINFEKPPEKNSQLTFLNKAKPKNTSRRPPTTKKTEVASAIPNSTVVRDKEEKPEAIPQQIIETNQTQAAAQSEDNLNIFADLPSRPEKKSKLNKKATTSASNKTKKPVEVNVDEIEDIFAIPNSKPSKKPKKSKVISDPLGAL